jgi:hypothetical protein
VSPKLFAALLAELERERVFSRDPDGTIYSRRMRKDDAREERNRRNGSRGGNPALTGKRGGSDNPGLTEQPGGKVKAQNPESRIQKPAAARERAREGGRAALFIRFSEESEGPLMAALGDRAPDDASVDALLDLADEVGLEPAIAAVIDAAKSAKTRVRTWGLLAKRARERLAAKPALHVVALAEAPSVFVVKDSPQWAAWCEHRNAGPLGLSYRWHAAKGENGRFERSEWPPGHALAQGA